MSYGVSKTLAALAAGWLLARSCVAWAAILASLIH